MNIETNNCGYVNRNILVILAALFRCTSAELLSKYDDVYFARCYIAIGIYFTKFSY